MTKKKLICTVGLPGAGKGIFLKAARSLDIPTYVMGDIIREKSREKYGKDDAFHTGLYMKEVRSESGRYAVAQFTVERIEEDMVKAPYILVDGVRNTEEIEYFVRKGYKIVLIAVLASLYTRYSRIMDRNRVDDVKNLTEFIARESREKDVGIMDVIRKADYYFINEDMDEEEGVKKARELLERILSDLG